MQPFQANKTAIGAGLTGGRQVHQGELDQITRFPYWEFFGTTTFPGVVCPSQGRRYKDAFAFLRGMASLAGLDFSRLFWVLRDEQGETTGRAHFHWLIGGTRLPLTKTSNFRIMWKSEEMTGGMARCAVYNRELAGAAYVSKCLSGEGTKGAHLYELDKFGWTERPPILSQSLVRFLLARERAAGSRSRTPQVVSTREGDGTAITRERSTRTNGGVVAKADKPREIIEASSLLYRLGRHPYGVGRGGSPG
jgi:hypothetical protein